MMISTLGNTLLPPSVLSQQQQPLKLKNKLGNKNGFFISCCSNNDISSTPPTTATSTSTISETPTPLVRRRKRYRKMYPGESTGVVEEMRFVAMKLRNDKPNIKIHKGEEDSITEEGVSPESSFEDSSDGVEETWQPSIEGFLKYLVDSKLVFETVERVVDESDNVAYSYFRKTGLERSGSILKDLEWFQEQDLTIPQPSSLGVSYAQYLKELAEKSPPLFLSHFYNIYFAHMSGGQVIAEKVSKKLLEGKELKFCTWAGDVPEMLKDVREKLNKLGEQWSRDEKNKCLREAAKSFRFLGQIVRLIIL